ADQRAGRQRPDRARDLPGDLPSAESARDDDQGGQPVDRTAARPAERAGLHPDQGLLLSSRARRAEPNRTVFDGGERVNRQAPSAARVLTMVAFAASCVGLLLFLWISFGGTTSLGPRGYEISAEFDQAVNLGSQADVRISGVNVGKV